MQRKLQFYLIREGQQFKLRFVQIKPSSDWERGGNGFMDPMLLAFLQHDINFIEQLYTHLPRFNQLPAGSQEAKDLYRAYALSDENEEETVIDVCDRQAAYAYKSRTYALPTTSKELFMLLGVLDSALHSVIPHRLVGEEEEGVVVEYCDKIPDFSRKAEICHYALAWKSPAERLPKKHLTRHVAEWMLREISGDAEMQTTHKALLETLQSMLATEGSLTPAIRQYLYPAPMVSALIADHCASADELTKTLLNPEVKTEHKREQLFKFIKETLWEKGKDDPVRKKNIHDQLTAWFAKLAEFRGILWHKRVESLYGKLAVDGGFYTDNYTEIVLLNEATFAINPQGLMELHFLKNRSSSYARNYAMGKRLFNKLEDEVRAACSDLDLHFLPGQNFHEKVVFDAPSSAQLKQWGYHFTESYCKDELSHDIGKRQFKLRFAEKDRPTNPFRYVPNDVIGLIMCWVNLGSRERAEARRREQGHVKEQEEQGNGMRLRLA